MTVLYALSPVVAMVDDANREARGLQPAHVQVACLLQRNFTPDRLLAALDRGVVPYLSQMRTLDIWGSPVVSADPACRLAGERPFFGCWL